ncbi:hypothetical protein HLRTI_000473 [Halorhabdus tiamatea SARL4B]|uniref:Uncharacterized protein n=1 Tax=Halorhabdus tiamatea SARL4B TaxID=1033806 RepID=F7PMI5_9EURY|nr:hypothetical protein [Halorhabdus tiamatea]ERJ07431.1 hypothetical protein HLRTI_000473 [Halorhabdus tiamatea SARL4B]
MAHYRFVADYPETGEAEVLFDGEPIERVPYTETSDDTVTITSGAGRSNVARSILEHAVETLDRDLGVDPAGCMSAFRSEFLEGFGSEEAWPIGLPAVEEFLDEQEQA